PPGSRGGAGGALRAGLGGGVSGGLLGHVILVLDRGVERREPDVRRLCRPPAQTRGGWGRGPVIPRRGQPGGPRLHAVADLSADAAAVSRPAFCADRGLRRPGGAVHALPGADPAVADEQPPPRPGVAQRAAQQPLAGYHLRALPGAGGAGVVLGVVVAGVTEHRRIEQYASR